MSARKIGKEVAIGPASSTVTPFRAAMPATRKLMAMR